jgi:hypothetical protein
MFEPGLPEFRGRILYFTPTSGERNKIRRYKHMIRYRMKGVIKWRIGKWSDWVMKSVLNLFQNLPVKYHFGGIDINDGTCYIIQLIHFVTL